MGGFAFADSVLALATINSVKINGAENAVVEPGKAVTATINVSLSGSPWRSTAYHFGVGIWNCVDTPDHPDGTTAEELLLINAPVKTGTSDVSFEVYENNDCTNGLGVASVASLLSAVGNAFSSGIGKIWLYVAFFVLITIVVSYFLWKNKRTTR